jgi:hypothetical protein
MKVFMTILILAVISAGQSNLYPMDSLVQPWHMDGLPQTIPKSELLVQYEKSGFTVNYLNNGKVIKMGLVSSADIKIDINSSKQSEGTNK